MGERSQFVGTNWILDYLTKQPQYVRARVCVSDMVFSSTGALQGTVLAPDIPLQSSDSAIIRLTDEDDREYRELTQDFVDWCLRNHLLINAGKTKDMAVDFRRCNHFFPPVNIQGMDIERVDSYKYLGFHLNNRLDWSENTSALYRKGQSRLYLLRRTFFDTVVALAIFYGAVCWGSSISNADLTDSLRGPALSWEAPIPNAGVGDRRKLDRLASMLENRSHPCFTPSLWSPSAGPSFRQLLDCTTNTAPSRTLHPPFDLTHLQHINCEFITISSAQYNQYSLWNTCKISL